MGELKYAENQAFFSGNKDHLHSNTSAMFTLTQAAARAACIFLDQQAM